MLLPDNIHPENTLLYNGGLIVRALRQLGDATLLDLYFEARKTRSMSMALFVLSLDWLYLANCVEINEEGTLWTTPGFSDGLIRRHRHLLELLR